MSSDCSIGVYLLLCVLTATLEEQERRNCNKTSLVHLKQILMDIGTESVLCVYVYVCVRVCTCVCTCVYVRVCTHTCASQCVCIYVEDVMHVYNIVLWH